MKKTSLRIEADLFEMLKGSPLASDISGKIYKAGTRPFNAKNEDAVLHYLTGLATQIQEGVVILNIYTSYIDSGDTRKIRNVARCLELETVLQNTLTYLNELFTEYLLENDGVIQTYDEDDIEQSFCSLRIKYKILET